VDLACCGCRLADTVGFALTAKTVDNTDSSGALASLSADEESLCFRIADGINRLECLLL
jgi:hypothetical protein